MTSSLIISTYNRPDALAVCLESVRNLSTLPDEVIVGDDGSRPDTESLVRSFQQKFPVPLLYVRQDDEGFRLAMIRNRCVALAKGEYIIQIDGDIFLHPDFVADHLQQARPGYFLKGGRVQLNPMLTEDICRKRMPRKISLLSKGIEAKRANALHLPTLAGFLAPRYRKNRINVLGCNLSFYRKDFLEVNGYDEDFKGWGGEDLDISFRFKNLGLGKRYLKFCGLAYHLWHREAPRTDSDRNHEMARKHLASGRIRASKGVDQYL